MSEIYACSKNYDFELEEAGHSLNIVCHNRGIGNIETSSNDPFVGSIFW